jgi:phosphoglycolate phosphatase/putative hydrolase of the HAD superfamily
MKIYACPERIAAFLFDMDGTLYTNPSYVQAQLDLPVQKLARLRGKTFEETQREIDDYRKKWAESHKGQKTSLANVFTAFGVSIEESARWREELYEPALHIPPDPVLRKTLEALRDMFFCSFALITNNPVPVAQKTLRALGVEAFFSVMVGLDTCFESKPNTAPFRAAVERLGTPFSACMAVGDRFDIDLAVPLGFGAGGVLVDGVEDVYKLPEILSRPLPKTSL